VILRLAAALALLLGATGMLLFLTIVGKAPWSPPEMRHLRAMKDRAGTPAAYTAYGTADFLALPHHPPLAATAALERRGVSFTGYAQYMVPSTDGDFHFELTAAPRRPDSPDTAYVTAEATPAFTRGRDGWAFERLVARLRPNHGGETPWEGGPRRVRVSGWLLYDFQYDLDRLAPAKRAQRLTGWEIHPVTRIEAWDDTLARFVEVPR
jgi:hypothetical protein